jgi:hypothetical protein
MKRDNRKLGIGLIGVILAIGGGGCGRSSAGSPVPAEALPAPFENRDPELQGLPKFAKLWSHSEDFQLNDPIGILSSASSGSLALRTEQFLNPSDTAVVLWIRSSASVHIHTEYHPYHTAFTDGDLTLGTIKITPSNTGLSENKDPSQGWIPIPISPGNSVSIQWVGAVPAGRVACKTSSPVLVQVSGSVSAEIRVTPADVSPTEATVDVPSLDPERVVVLEAGSRPISESWGTGDPDVFRYLCGSLGL